MTHLGKRFIQAVSGDTLGHVLGKLVRKSARNKEKINEETSNSTFHNSCLSFNSTFLTYKTVQNPSTQRQRFIYPPDHKKNPSTSSSIFQPQSPPLVQRPYPTTPPPFAFITQPEKPTEFVLDGFASPKEKPFRKSKCLCCKACAQEYRPGPGVFGMNPSEQLQCPVRSEPGGSFFWEILNENQQEILKPAFLMSIWITNLLRFKQQVFTSEKVRSTKGYPPKKGRKQTPVWFFQSLFKHIFNLL